MKIPSWQNKLGKTPRTPLNCGSVTSTMYTLGIVNVIPSPIPVRNLPTAVQFFTRIGFAYFFPVHLLGQNILFWHKIFFVRDKNEIFLDKKIPFALLCETLKISEENPQNRKINQINKIHQIHHLNGCQNGHVMGAAMRIRAVTKWCWCKWFCWLFFKIFSAYFLLTFWYFGKPTPLMK